jgi:hypothetical protein
MADAAALAGIVDQARKPLADVIGTIADDVLRGCPAIGAYIGKTEREARWAIERGWLPAWREGSTWCASREALRRHYAELASKPIDPVALAKEREAKNLARRKRAPSMPIATMEGVSRRRQAIGQSLLADASRNLMAWPLYTGSRITATLAVAISLSVELTTLDAHKEADTPQLNLEAALGLSTQAPACCEVEGGCDYGSLSDHQLVAAMATCRAWHSAQ